MTGGVDPCLRFGRPRLRPATEPLELPAHPRPHPLLPLRLRGDVSLLLLEECAVVSLDDEGSPGEAPVHLDHSGCTALEEVTVMADDDGREAGTEEEILEHITPSRSRWLVGSSRSRRSGVRARAQAIARRFSQPPERVSTAADGF